MLYTPRLIPTADSSMSIRAHTGQLRSPLGYREWGWSNLCLPNLIFGRVVWTFQLARTGYFNFAPAELHKTHYRPNIFIFYDFAERPPVHLLRIFPANEMRIRLLEPPGSQSSLYGA
jgi:hypothetical protein